MNFNTAKDVISRKNVYIKIYNMFNRINRNYVLRILKFVLTETENYNITKMFLLKNICTCT